MKYLPVGIASNLIFVIISSRLGLIAFSGKEVIS
jgi:hypothetical protein